MSTKFLKALIPVCLYAIAALSTSASAEEYKSMIRYDRIWECVSSRWFVNSVNYMKFDGTEEINGKTYHRLVTFRKAGFDYSDDAEHKPHLYDQQDDICENEGYLREEDGVVYTLVANNGPLDSPERQGILYVAGNDHDKYPYLTEEVIYNFNCKEGESYEGITFSGIVEKMTFSVHSVSTVEIDGESCKRFEIRPVVDAVEWETVYPVIEGIGAAVEGCLNYHEFFDQPTYPYAHHALNRVFDTDGNLLYASEDYWGDIPYGENGVESIQHKPVEDNPPIYDILGRRILAPAPGQLYIQNGKKHIAK